jgi:hypothetical protein
MVWNQFARVVITFALLCMPMAAQQAQDAPTHITLQGVVQTPDKTPVPGASVHIVEQTSGKSWITWTDETGKFRLPELPIGKFHIDATQIGFGSAGADVAPTTEKSDDIVMVLKIASAQEIAAANAASQAASAPAAVTPATPGITPPTTTDAAKNQTTTPPATDATKPGTTGAKPDATKPGTQTARNGNGRGGQQGGGRGAGRGGFTGVDVNGAGAGAADANDQGGAGTDATGLGNAASSDALLVAGTTAQGAGGGFPMMMGMGGEGGGDPNNPGFPGGIPGQGDNGGFGGVPGVPGGGGAPGGGGRGPGGGGPGGGGRGPGGGGPGGGRGGRGAQGPNGVPWGLNSVIRRRINQIHYTLNETLQDSAFDARTWQANGQPQAKLPFSNNLFGGSIGGPLRIPHIYDGRDKTYFFLNVNLGHGDTANFLTGNVPTALERAGNFCSSSSTGGPLALFNFASSSPTNLNTPRTPLAGTGPNNCDISSMINPTAASLLALVPLPNQTPTSENPNNFLLQEATPTNRQTISARINQTISPKLNFAVQYNIAQVQSSGQGLFPVEISSSSSRAQVVNVTFNQNISPKLINSVVLNFTRSRSNQINGFANGTDEEALLGITGASTNPFNFGLPNINLNSSNGELSYSGFNDVIPRLTRNETYYLQDTLTWTHGKHATHFGATVRRVQINTDTDPNPRGTFSFTGVMTENFAPSTTNPAVFNAVPNTGSPLADFELGLPQGTSVQFGDSFNYLRSRAFIAYFTDDWKIKPRFTLTYGLRYELLLPATELFGHLADLDVNPADFTAIQQVTPANNVGPFTGAFPSSLIRPNYHNFAPRVSIAWRVPGKYFDANNGKHALVVRAGYNVFDNSNAYNIIDNHLLNQAPFATNFSNTVQQPSQALSFATGLQPLGPTINTYAVSPNYTNPVVQIWNVSLESQFIDGFTWQVSYIGTKGSNLDVYSAPNLLNVTNNAIAASGAIVSPIASKFTYTFDSSGASSIYNALQVRLQKRMRNGFTFTTIYTYSKSVDDASSIGGGGQTVIQDFPNFSFDRGLSSFDMRNQLTGSSTYELPFGERKRFAHKGVSAKILGNLRLSGSTTFHTGMPLQPVVLGELTAINSGASLSTRPDILAGCNPNLFSSQVTVSQAFNVSCFAAPGKQFPASPEFPNGGRFAPPGLAGNAGRDIVRGPDSIVVNMALAKSITLGRDAQRHLDLRWEVNNIANHPNWSGFGLTVGSRNFGEVLGASAMRTMQAVIRLNF